jgi:hypothetical protein
MITVKSIPNYGTYISAHNDMFFVVESTNVAQTNFKFVFDVYIDAALVTRIKVFPDPTYNYGVFNAGPIIRSYLDNLYFGGENDFLTTKETDGYFKKAYVIKYGEEYGAPPTIYTNLVTSATYEAYNYYNSILQNASVARLDDYENNFLRTLDGEVDISLSDNYFISHFNPATATFTLNVYDASGLTHTQTIDTSLLPTSGELLQLNCGPLGINATYGTVTPWIDDETTYYTVSDGVNTMRFNLDCWSKYPNQTLIFLNKLGGYETAHFRFKSRRTISKESKSFGRIPWEIRSDGTISYNIGDTNALRGTSQTYSVKHNNRYRFSTHLLTDDEYLWLSGLFASSQVYMEFKSITQYGDQAVIITEGGVDIITEDGLNLLMEGSANNYFMQNSATYIPVKIVPDSLEVKTRRADGLQALELEIELMQNYNSQYA